MLELLHILIDMIRIMVSLTLTLIVEYDGQEHVYMKQIFSNLTSIDMVDVVKNFTKAIKKLQIERTAQHSGKCSAFINYELKTAYYLWMEKMTAYRHSSTSEEWYTNDSDFIQNIQIQYNKIIKLDEAYKTQVSKQEPLIDM